MDFFQEATLRLKQQLEVTQDKEVARFLGLSPRAWAGRKQSNAFPEIELRALAQQRPELGIDVDYVLTGGLAGPNVAVAMGRDPAAVAGPVAVALGTDVQAVQGDEARLLAAFRAADSAGRTAILMAATGIAALAQN